MMTHTTTLTVRAARESARSLLAAIDGRQWDISAAEAALPHGWRLIDIEQTDLYPLTVEHVAAVLRRAAMPE